MSEDIIDRMPEGMPNRMPEDLSNRISDGVNWMSKQNNFLRPRIL